MKKSTSAGKGSFYSGQLMSSKLKLDNSLLEKNAASGKSQKTFLMEKSLL